MNDPEFVLKKTVELSNDDKQQIRDLFRDVFGKEKTADHFDREFLDTPLGHSYHVFMRTGPTIVGCYSAIPYRYRFFGRECLFALSVDTMIAESHRGLDRLTAMAKRIYAALLADGIEFAFGFPNDNIYKIRKRFLGWKDIGQLDYFVLPVRAGAFKSWARPLNFLTLLAARAVTGLFGPRRSAALRWPIDRIEDDRFIRHRYGLFGGNYHRATLPSGGVATYRIDRHEGLRVAYLVDVSSISPRQLFEATRLVLARHSQEIDAILYLGILPFRPTSLLRVPKRFEPKKEYMSGKILAGKIVDDRIYDIANWKVNLSTFDVV